MWRGPVSATDVLMPGGVVVIKDMKLFKMVAKPVAPALFPIPTPGSGSDPLLNDSSVSVFDTTGVGVLDDTLAAGAWQGLGNPPGSAGYKYKNPAAPAGGNEVKVVVLKENVVKIIAKDDESLNGPVSGNVGVVLSTGTDRYGASFGGTPVENQSGFVKRKAAPAPGAIPVHTPPFSCAGCNGHGFIDFTATSSRGDCGDIIDATGMTTANIDCSGLYVGGGANAWRIPYPVRNEPSAVTKITSCTGSVAMLGHTTSAETGSSENCTNTGCRFGPPLAVPNPANTPNSLCLLNSVAAPAIGTIDCSTGATGLILPLWAAVYLTGDTATDPMNTIAGIQPCPLCAGMTCTGGANNGMACAPDNAAGDPSYPTSHDCPPLASLELGSIPVAFALTTGTLAWTATTPTNDTGSTASLQNRVFSGFCRDVDGTGDFAGGTIPTAQQCWENGMAIGPPCSGVFESCEQRSNGAFGPNGDGNMTIRAFGNAMSIIGSPAPLTLVSIFSVRPTFEPTMDGPADLPGPGAVALPVMAQSCATANFCP
jgi:hypothetical protein